jgi:hypothetical protein
VILSTWEIKELCACLPTNNVSLIKKFVMPEGSTIRQSSVKVSLKCYTWSPINNFIVIKKICDTERMGARFLPRVYIQLASIVHVRSHTATHGIHIHHPMSSTDEDR